MSAIPVDAVSLSITITATSRPARPDAPLTAWLTVAVSFAESASSRAVTVTVRTVLQSNGVNRSNDGDTVTSGSPETSGVTVTVPDGAESSTTV